MHKFTMTIKYLDDNTEVEVIGAIGNPNTKKEMEEDIFHFFKSEEDIKHYTTKGVHDFIVLNYQLKKFRWHSQIGKAKYVVSYHDGEKKHKDGSNFFDMHICNNKVNLNKFIKSLINDGYMEE